MYFPNKTCLDPSFRHSCGFLGQKLHGAFLFVELIFIVYLGLTELSRCFSNIRISPAISTQKYHQSAKRQKGNLGSFFGENNGAFKKLMIFNTYRFHLIMSNIKHIFRKQIGQEHRPPVFLEHSSFLAA